MEEIEELLEEISKSIVTRKMEVIKLLKIAGFEEYKSSSLVGKFLRHENGFNIDVRDIVGRDGRMVLQMDAFLDKNLFVDSIPDLINTLDLLDELLIPRDWSQSKSALIQHVRSEKLDSLNI